MPERHGQDQRLHDDARRNPQEYQRGVVAPLEEAIEHALRSPGRTEIAESGAGGAMSVPSANTCTRMRRAREADEAQRADGLAPLVDQHHHQRQQEHGAADHR